jgi:hypothetical protein
MLFSGGRITPSLIAPLATQPPAAPGSSTLGEIKMIKTLAIALVCVASVVSMAQAQTSGSAGAGAPVGAGSSGGGANGSTGIIGGGSVVTPPASTGASGSTSQPSRPTIDTNRAQQPGIGVNSGASSNGSIKPLGR